MSKTVFEKKEKDICVEILRIIGMMIVVFVHVKPGDYVGGAPDIGRIALSAILADGVPIFWFILGFFLFRKKMDWEDVLKRTIIRIFIPLLLYSLFVWFFCGFLTEGKTIAESFTHTGEEYQQIWKFGILKWTNVLPMSGQIWYLYVYIAIMLLYPALKGMWDYGIKESKNDKATFAMLFLLLVLNDVFINKIFEFSYTGIFAVIGASIFIYAGAMLYEWVNLVSGKIKWAIIGVLLFVGSNIIRTVVQYYYYMYSADQIPHFMNWYTSFSMLAAIGFVMIVYGLCGKIKWNHFARKFVCHMGTISFYVYFIHMIILECFKSAGIHSMVQEFIGQTWWGDIVFVIGYGLFILLCSVLISEVLYFILQSGKMVYKKL